ncbi:PTS fructose transporter subunit IIB, partial [Streptococcus pneumoniae]
MKIVGVAACTVGIAHTYIAQEKLENAAKVAGHVIHVETQGTIGVENELSQEQ